MRSFFVCLFFFCFWWVSATENHPAGTVYRISETNKGLNWYVRLLVTSYFPVKALSLSSKVETEHLLKKDDRRVTNCRNKIALKSNLKSWFNNADFEKLSPAFRDVLQERISAVRTYEDQLSDAEKIAMIISPTLSWTEGIALIRKVYGEGDDRYVDIKTLEDSLF